jgi:hypothetical protein
MGAHNGSKSASSYIRRRVSTGARVLPPGTETIDTTGDERTRLLRKSRIIDTVHHVILTESKIIFSA